MRLRLDDLMWTPRVVSALGRDSTGRAGRCVRDACEAVARGEARVSLWPSWPETYRHCACDRTILILVTAIAGRRLGLVVEIVDHSLAPELI